MTCVALDTNVLVYAELEHASAEGRRAREAIRHCSGTGVLAVQVLGELIAVVRRRPPAAVALALRQIEQYRLVFNLAPTDADVVVAAGAFAGRHRPQLWDAVIWQAPIKGRATVLLTEDLQDGLTAEGMRAVSPSAAPDWATLAADLGRRP